MLINLSNHPSNIWSAEQIATANRLYGEIIDLPFPGVDPDTGEESIVRLADEYVHKAQKIADGQPFTIHLMGEMTLCFALLIRFQHLGITCVASTTKREVHYNEDGSKLSEFCFVQFRKYLSIEK